MLEMRAEQKASDLGFRLDSHNVDGVQIWQWRRGSDEHLPPFSSKDHGHGLDGPCATYSVTLQPLRLNPRALFRVTRGALSPPRYNSSEVRRNCHAAQLRRSAVPRRPRRLDSRCASRDRRRRFPRELRACGVGVQVDSWVMPATQDLPYCLRTLMPRSVGHGNRDRASHPYATRDA